MWVKKETSRRGALLRVSTACLFERTARAISLTRSPSSHERISSPSCSAFQALPSLVVSFSSLGRTVYSVLPSSMRLCSTVPSCIAGVGVMGVRRLWSAYCMPCETMSLTNVEPYAGFAWYSFAGRSSSICIASMALNGWNSGLFSIMDSSFTRPIVCPFC